MQDCTDILARGQRTELLLITILSLLSSCHCQVNDHCATINSILNGLTNCKWMIDKACTNLYSSFVINEFRSSKVGVLFYILTAKFIVIILCKCLVLLKSTWATVELFLSLPLLGWLCRTWGLRVWFPNPLL